MNTHDSMASRMRSLNKIKASERFAAVLSGDGGEPDHDEVGSVAARETIPTPLEMARELLEHSSKLVDGLRMYRVEVVQRIAASQRELVEIDAAIAKLPSLPREAENHDEPPEAA